MVFNWPLFFLFFFKILMKIGKKWKTLKGQIISKLFFSGRGFSQKTNENMSHTSKTNSFVRFLEEYSAWQFAFEINWPLSQELFLFTQAYFCTPVCQKAGLLIYLSLTINLFIGDCRTVLWLVEKSVGISTPLAFRQTGVRKYVCVQSNSWLK